MKVNYLSATFWFNIFERHTEILESLQVGLKDEYQDFRIFNYSDNLIAPVIVAENNKKKTNMSFSQINLQYNMDNVSLENLEVFKENTLKIFEVLTSNGIEVVHSAIFVNCEVIDNDALKTISKNTISKRLYNEDLVDMTLKLGKKHEDLFYKIITVLNKKQIKLPKKIDEQGRIVPIPLISWNGSLVENEIIDISYEINDKYLFDFTKNYHTTEFYLNKMLYILSEDIENDIENLLKKGEF